MGVRLGSKDSSSIVTGLEVEYKGTHTQVGQWIDGVGGCGNSPALLQFSVL